MLRFSDKQYPGRWQHTAPGVILCTECVAHTETTPLFTDFKLVRSKRPGRTHHTQNSDHGIVQVTPTRIKSAQGLATSQATKPPDEIVHIRYILFTYGLQTLCVRLWRPGEMWMRSLQRIDGPTLLRSGAQYKFSSPEHSVVLIPYCAISRAPSGIACRRYAHSKAGHYDLSKSCRHHT